jgi:8-oxo-dGTP pyrophosphatase MutT (NUDIX family)
MLQGASLRILSYYRDTNKATFTQLCQHADYPSDLGSYYIRKLVQAGYLKKVVRGHYDVTAKGKKQLIDLTVQGSTSFRFSRTRLIVLFVVTQGDHYVCQKRTVQPFIGKIEWPGGESLTGEELPVAAERLLRERLGIQRTPRLQGFFRRIDRYNGEWFDDKLFALHTLELPADTALAKEAPRGELIRLSEGEIRSLGNASRALRDILDYCQAGKTAYEEHVYELQPSDLS